MKRPAIIKTCYEHLGGKFGNRLLIRFEELGWIKKAPGSKDFVITPQGEKELKKLGIETFDLRS